MMLKLCLYLAFTCLNETQFGREVDSAPARSMRPHLAWALALVALCGLTWPQPALANRSQLTLFLFSSFGNFSLAVCNDGSSAGLYFKAGTDPNKFVIHMQVGQCLFASVRIRWSNSAAASLWRQQA